MSGILYVVGLPIGNSKDLSPRAREILSKSDVIACEDTRDFKSLMNECGIEISAQLFAHHDHNEKESSQELIKYLIEGKNIALVSDAGTPGINDPGFDLLSKTYANGIPVKVVPGASSLTSALSASPIGGKTTLFIGFLPSDETKRVSCLKENARKADRIVFFESPHRVQECLTDILNHLGDIEISVHRELTKTYEESIYLKTSLLIDHFRNNPPKGEFVIIMRGLAEPRLSLSELKEEIKKLLKLKMKDTEIASQLSHLSDLGRKEIYKIVQSIKEK